MGTKVSCLIDEVTTDSMSVSLATGVEGEILPLDYDSSLTSYNSADFIPGTKIEATVCCVVCQGYKLGLSMHPRCLEDLEPGSSVDGIIIRKPAQSSLSEEIATVQLPGHREAFLFCTDVTEVKSWEKNPLQALANRERRTVTVLGTTLFFKKEVTAVTLRSDVLAQQQTSVQENQSVCGFVVNSGMKGVQVRY